MPGDATEVRLALLGGRLPHRRGERFEIAPGDLSVVAPVQRPDAPAALGAMVQADHLPAQLLQTQGHRLLRPRPHPGGLALRQALLPPIVNSPFVAIEN